MSNTEKVVCGYKHSAPGLCPRVKEKMCQNDIKFGDRIKQNVVFRNLNYNFSLLPERFVFLLIHIFVCSFSLCLRLLLFWFLGFWFSLIKGDWLIRRNNGLSENGSKPVWFNTGCFICRRVSFLQGVTVDGSYFVINMLVIIMFDKIIA